MAKEKETKFEDKIKELETIINELESGDKLKNIEEQVNKIVKENGELENFTVEE